MKKILLFVLLLFAFLLIAKNVLADECNPSCSGIDECQRKIDECQKLLNLSLQATKPHEERIADMERDIGAIEANVRSLTAQIEEKKKNISINEKHFMDRQKTLNAEVRDFYKKDYQISLDYLLTILLSNSEINEKVRMLAYRQSLVNEEKRNITTLAVEISDLISAQKKLEASEEWLREKVVSLQITLKPIKELVLGAKKYQSELNQTVGTLSSRQKELLAEKTGNFSTSVGDVPDTQDENSSLDGFRRNAPGGSIAGFSFGAPHRKGMSQYGSFGRAKSGQNAETMLSAYYPGTELKKDYRTDININVRDFGTSWNIEDYVKRIYEVPNSWGDEGGFEALKAQAVAARSYALAYTNNGSGSICATESCQVAKREPKGGNWDRAVNDTKGWVLVSGGNPYSAWYAASSGGYNTPGGWDTKCGSQSCWTNDAYEKIAQSPWFYKAWYKPRRSSASRPNAWLSKDESLDIVNAVFLYKKDNGTLSHLSQIDKPNGDTWSREKVRQELGSRGESPLDSIDSVNVTYSTGGYTNKVTINGREISGTDFRQIFNIRAPGEIWLASELFNIEKK